MPRLPRAYKATAHYAKSGAVSRTFLTRRSRDRWADQRLAGYPEEPPLTPDPYDDGRPALEPATHVVVADSVPLTWQPEETRRAHP